MRLLVVLLVGAGFAGLTMVASAFTTREVTLSDTVLRQRVCGIERWPAKTLADPGSARLRLHPVKTTVQRLARLRVHVGFGGVRGAGAERQVFRVRVRLLSMKQEDDLDFHVVVADLVTGQTMIVEFPNTACTHGAKLALRRRMQRARRSWVRSCGFPPNSRFRPLAGVATIVGPAFFDRPHNQTGMAPNAVEIHPVLTFGGRCR